MIALFTEGDVLINQHQPEIANIPSPNDVDPKILEAGECLCCYEFIIQIKVICYL